MQFMIMKIVSDGLKPGTYNLFNQPKHLTPDEWHNSLSIAKENKDSITLIDMRNHYERYPSLSLSFCFLFPLRV